MGCGPWGRCKSGTTKRLHFHFSLSCIGEGNGNPLQCSCLENPRDGGAWWASVYGVAQSRTRLKQLSSSSKDLLLIGFMAYGMKKVKKSMHTCAQLLSHVHLFVTPWTATQHTPLSMGFLKQEYWNQLPFPSTGDLLTQGLNPHLLHWQADSLPRASKEALNKSNDNTGDGYIIDM